MVEDDATRPTVRRYIGVWYETFLKNICASCGAMSIVCRECRLILKVYFEQCRMLRTRTATVLDATFCLNTFTVVVRMKSRKHKVAKPYGHREYLSLPLSLSLSLSPLSCRRSLVPHYPPVPPRWGADRRRQGWRRGLPSPRSRRRVGDSSVSKCSL